MSNDGNTPPPPPPPPPPSDDPTPEQGIGGLAEPPADDALPPTGIMGVSDQTPPPVDATQVMPVTPATPTLPDAAPPRPPVEPGGPYVAPGAIPPTPTPTQTLPPEAWYRKPGAVAGILLGLLVVGAIVIFLVVASGGDDDADGVLEDVAPEAVSLVVTRLGSGGQALDTTLSATVAVQTPEADAYTWVIPSDGVVGQAGLRQTDATGRVEFRWAPSDGVDAASWTSTVEIAEFIAAEGEQAVTELAVDCSLQRDGTEEAIVGEGTVQINANDPLATIGNYSFPNLGLTAGDRIDCTSTNVVADPAPVITESTTTVPESTTTVPESTTTVAETTTSVADTTTTEAETTTTSSTTTSSTTTTTSTTVAPPPASPALTAFLSGQPELADAAALLDRVGLLSELESSGEPFTLFVPTNNAIEALEDGDNPPDLSDDDVVRELFGAHIQRGAQLDDPSTVTEVAVSNGGPQPVDSSANPITVGGVDVISIGNQVDGGVVHVLGGVLTVQP